MQFQNIYEIAPKQFHVLFWPQIASNGIKLYPNSDGIISKTASIPSQTKAKVLNLIFSNLDRFEKFTGRQIIDSIGDQTVIDY